MGRQLGTPGPVFLCSQLGPEGWPPLLIVIGKVSEKTSGKKKSAASCGGEEGGRGDEVQGCNELGSIC